jgi:hypothetical protein
MYRHKVHMEMMMNIKVFEGASLLWHYLLHVWYSSRNWGSNVGL